MYDTYRNNRCSYGLNESDIRDEISFHQHSHFYNYDLIDDVDFSREFGDCQRIFDDEHDIDISFNPIKASRNIKAMLRDYGPNPLVIDIDEATEKNNAFRSSLWTGGHLQVTLMSIKPSEDIGLELHRDTDQFIRIEEGRGIVKMGKTKDKLDFQANVKEDMAIMIPAGTWHNVINTGNKPLKVYSIYAPPHHPKNTVHMTKADAEAAESNYR